MSESLPGVGNTAVTSSSVSPANAASLPQQQQQQPVGTVASSSIYQQLVNDGFAMSTVYEHCAHFPPHGPYAHLSAVSLSTVLQQRHQLTVPPSVLITVFQQHFRLDHLREWPSLYVAAELRIADVDNL